MAKIRGKEKIVIVCRYENWCVTWFKQLLNFLILNVYPKKREVVRENYRHRSINIPEKEIIFISSTRENELTRGINPHKIIHWNGREVNDLWNKI